MSSEARRVEHQMTDKGYVPIYTTAVVDQPWADYTKTEHETWATLFRRQRDVLKGRACREFIDNQERFGMTPDAIPRFEELNEVLAKATDWQLVGVEGLLPELTFFDHLANRRFPVTWWIRKPEQIDYISEPDLFHDLFGHVPLLTLPVFADYMQAYGEGGLKASHLQACKLLARLYWYTVEFGLVQQKEGLRIYGAGIASSFSESTFSVQSDSPNRIGFDLERVMRTNYRIDDFQETYFVLDKLEDLLALANTEFAPYYARLDSGPTYQPGDVLPTDKVPHHGTGSYHRARAAAATATTAKV